MNSTADRRLKALEARITPKMPARVFQLFTDHDRPIADLVETFKVANDVGPQDHLVVISFQ
jgi:hypothetical protein